LKYYGNFAFHLLQDVRDNSISPIHHKADEEVPILHTMLSTRTLWGGYSAHTTPDSTTTEEDGEEQSRHKLSNYMYNVQSDP